MTTVLTVTVIIAPKSKTQRPLHHRHRTNSDDEAAIALTSNIEKDERPKRERSYSSATESDDFSLWSDTGDITEQLADDEDPLRIELDPLNSQGKSVEKGRSGGSRGKKVSFKHQDNDHNGNPVSGINKEDITIPSPAVRRVRTAEKLLAFIMAPGDPQTARSRGLVGKPLLYVDSNRNA